MRIDLHNHTPRCKHATNAPLDSIKQASKIGINVFGFSCHAPMNFDEKYRMDLSELDDYLNEIDSLKNNEFGIEILNALEVDYFVDRPNLIESSVINADVDYLIGSVHFLDSWGFDNPEFIGEYAKRDLEKCWIEYLDSIKKMAESKLFQIIGHLDLLKIFNNAMPSSLESNLDSLLNAIKQANMCVEINAAGFRKPIKEQYPSEYILKKIKDLDIPITFSSDAHSIEQIGLNYDLCLNLAKKIGFKKARIYRKKIPFDIDI